YFFFQAEDGIRDKLVTGVQTCALPICHHPGKHILLGFIPRHRFQPAAHLYFEASRHFSKFSLTALNVLFRDIFLELDAQGSLARSEERRVGKECESWRGW